MSEYERQLSANIEHLKGFADAAGIIEGEMFDWDQIEEFIGDIAMWLALNGVEPKP